MLRKRYVCPNNCGDKFYTVAHITQEWEVDGLGNFIEVSIHCLETTHGPNNDNVWVCTKCGVEAIILDDAAYKGAFEYGGYHFRPYRKFYKGEINRRLKGDSRPWKMDGQYAMRNMSSDRSLGMSTYAWRKCDYSHNDFYAKAGDSDFDIFQCVENGKLYVPHENELFQYKEPAQRKHKN